MMQSALRLIADGEAVSSEQLAHRLDVRPEVAREMLLQLARLGYLRPSGGTCQATCAGCHLGQACFAATQMWALTDKGRRAALAA